ncbi:MAG: hypothetical protein GYB67_03090 [Chloroflexi bacterium]|nr:hypothetical protein [Chloroflexota bacterium]
MIDSNQHLYQVAYRRFWHDPEIPDDAKTLMLCCAVPLLLTPELVQHIRVNFLARGSREAPDRPDWDADVLLAPFVTRVTGSYYQIDAETRAQLRRLLHSRELFGCDGAAIERQIAELVRAYVRRRSDPENPARAAPDKYLDHLRLGADAILNPDQIIERIANLVQNHHHKPDAQRERAIEAATLARTFNLDLILANVGELADYTRQRAHYAQGLLETVPERYQAPYSLTKDIRLPAIGAAAATQPTIHYQTAKIVVIGESSAGKTQLSRALLGHSFDEVFGTNNVNAALLRGENPVERPNGDLVWREIYLWDLAGQGNLKLVHQLYMGDVALALLVFDGNKDDPLRGLRSWVHIVDEAQHTGGDREGIVSFNGSQRPRKFLVEARADQGGFANLSERTLRDFCNAVNVTQHFRTSAKTHKGIDELRASIFEEIDWQALPQDIPQQVFNDIREFVRQLQAKDTIELAPVEWLYELFVESSASAAEADDALRDQFDACIRFLEAQGQLHHFEFGDLVLLKSELLNAYAHAIIDAARQGDGGTLGYVEEQAIWRGEIDVADEQRIRNPRQESWMLISTVHDLIKHEIALRDDRKLIFPSYFANGNSPDFDQVGMQEVKYAFEGLPLRVYSVLVVRLTQSRFFHRKQLARNKVQFLAEEGGLCGITLDASEELQGCLELYFEPAVQQITRYTFDLFVYTLLRKLVGHDKFKRARFFSCTNPNCSTYRRLPFDLDMVEARRNNGKTDIICPVCEERTQLIEPSLETMSEDLRERLRQMNRNVNLARDRHSAEAALEGKRATDNFDVFFYASPREAAEINRLEAMLAERGIYCFPSGQESLQDAQLLNKVKSLAIFVGEHGLHPDERRTAEDLIQRGLDQGVRVVVVLAQADSRSLSLMEQFHESAVQWVYFFAGVDDEAALADLDPAITGRYIG